MEAPAPAIVAEPTQAFAPAAPVSAAKAAPKPEESEEVDPISEADLFLNFGRDAQAEEILKDAIRKSPANVPVQLKLLSVYANRKDANAFSGIARQLKDSGDAAAWEQAAALGRAIDPGNPMYGGGEAAPAALAESAKPVTPGVDMDIGFNVPMDLDVTAAMPAMEPGAATPMDFDVSGLAGTPMDFDVSGAQKNAPAGEALSMTFDITGSQPKVGEGLAMDFDVTSSRPSVAAPAHLDFDITSDHPVAVEPQPVDFDVTGSRPNVTALHGMEFHAAEPAPQSLEVPALDFDVTSGFPSVPEMPGTEFDVAGIQPGGQKGAPEQHAGGMPELSMDFDISASPAAAGGAKAEETPVLDIGGLTFDISAPSPAPSKQPALDMDLALEGISLNLEEPSAQETPSAVSGKGEQWQEVATKLDLARAYQEMGDAEGAREILGEVLRDGDEQQREAAQTLLQQL